MAEFCHPRPSRSRRSLPRSPIRRRVSSDISNIAETRVGLTKHIQESLCDPCEACHNHATRHSACSTNTWALGGCLITATPLFIYFSRLTPERFATISLLCPLFLCTPQYPSLPTATPLPFIRLYTTTIPAALSALGHTTNIKLP